MALKIVAHNEVNVCDHADADDHGNDLLPVVEGEFEKFLSIISFSKMNSLIIIVKFIAKRQSPFFSPKSEAKNQKLFAT